MKKIYKLVFLFFYIINTYGFENICASKIANIKNLPKNTSQILLIKTTSKLHANIILCEKKYSHWHAISRQYLAIIGAKGLAKQNSKKEGDLKTPSGLFPLGEVFSSAPVLTKMDFKYVTQDDKFIDDPQSDEYNKWHFGPTKAKSYENMLNNLYKIGIVIKYNSEPVIANLGSAIFIHIWESSTTPTHGCIALESKNLLKIIKKLDKNQNPYVNID